MIEKYNCVVKDINENPNISVIDYLTNDFKETPDFIIDFLMENIKDEGYKLDAESK